MAHGIERNDGYFEVQVSGATSKYEVLEIVRELARRDPGKKFPDLWIISRESQIAFEYFRDIAEAVRSLLPPGQTGNKTALVAADRFHEAQLDMYRCEASILPFDVRVFRSRDEAVEWFREPRDTGCAVVRGSLT